MVIGWPHAQSTEWRNEKHIWFMAELNCWRLCHCLVLELLSSRLLSKHRRRGLHTLCFIWLQNRKPWRRLLDCWNVTNKVSKKMLPFLSVYLVSLSYFLNSIFSFSSFHISLSITLYLVLPSFFYSRLFFFHYLLVFCCSYFVLSECNAPLFLKETLPCGTNLLI